jgi:hypothetical protein
MKEDEIGQACITHGRAQKYIRLFGGKLRIKETTRET